MHQVGAVLMLVIAPTLAGCRAQAPPDAADEAATPVVSVEVTPIVRATLRAYVEASGVVEPQPATAGRQPARARVAAPVPGLLAEIRCAEGQRVAKGTVIFRLDGRVADLAVAKAVQSTTFAEGAFDRQRQLGAGEATSQRLYQEAEQALALARNELALARMQRTLLDVTAPIAGTVVSVSARPGDAVDPATVLAEIVDLDRLVVSAAIRTADVPRIAKGQPVELVGANAPTVVGFIGDAVDPRTDTVVMRAPVPRATHLRPGQFVSLRIQVGECRDCLSVPIDSLVADAATTLVAVVQNDVATKRVVQPGLRDARRVAIQGEGIAEGQLVVSVGAYGLPRESRVRVVKH
jgi:RND family efflux transporter MFP subunit